MDDSDSDECYVYKDPKTGFYTIIPAPPPRKSLKPTNPVALAEYQKYESLYLNGAREFTTTNLFEEVMLESVATDYHIPLMRRHGSQHWEINNR